MRIAVNLLALLILSGCGPKPSSETCAIIHKPAKADCPKGYVQEQTPRFTERDGSKEFACLSDDPTKEQCTDELRPGESETLHLFELPAAPPASVIIATTKEGRTMNPAAAIYRQGDVLIRRIADLPKQKAAQRKSGILAEGEVTGHAHKIEDLTAAEVLEIENGLYLRVGEEGVRIVHEEHAPISLAPGNYEVEIQREYSPAAIQNVAD